ncbi:MAG TPA: oligopeptidase B, partial [Thermoanaerobaculia bacterium]
MTAFAANSLTAQTDIPKPPVAKKVPKSFQAHGETRVDEYGWLRDKKSPETIAYLEAENAYADALTKGQADLSKKLYAEMLGRIKQTDVNVPYRDNGYFYYTRTVEGKQYPIHARRKGNMEAAEEILLDVNVLAEGKKFMSLGAYSVSDDNNLLAYTTDDNGYRQYKLHVKDLRSGAVTANIAERVGSVEWGADNKTLFYSTENDAKRSNRIFRHVLGSTEHELLLDEKDELYDVWVDRTRDGKWLTLYTESKKTSEVRLLAADKPAETPKVMLPRRQDHLYYVDSRGDRFYVMTNDKGLNFRVVTAPIADPAEKNWVELVPYRKPVRIESVDLFANHMVVRLRENGLQQFEIYDLRPAGANAGKSHRISFPEPAYAAGASANAEFETNVFRYAYQSLVTPGSIYDYDMDARSQKLLKRTEVIGYDPA